MGNEMTGVMLALTAIIPITGFLSAATPFLMKRNEVFAVTVPTSAASDSYLRRLKHRFAAIVAAATLLLTGAGIMCSLNQNECGFAIVLVVGSIALCAGSYALMLRYRAKTQAYKKERGWQAASSVAVSVVSAGADSAPKAVSMKWDLLYIPVILVTLAVGLAGYPFLPDMVPMHMSLSGVVDSWAPKSLGIVLFPVAGQVFLAVCFVIAHWSVVRSKKPIDSQAPAASAWAYGLFARAQSAFVVACGILFALSMGVTVELSFLGIISLWHALVIVLVVCAFAMAGAVVLSVVYGQSGARVFKGLAESDTMHSDDDAHWKWGIFYWNPQDASLFLPERFGVGWTMNWARPATWALVLAFVAVTVAFVVGVFLLV